MSSVWKRLQRVNKRAAKFQFTASYHRIDLETTAKWKPNKLSVVWSRRSRRVVAEPLDWEPSMKEPLKGSAIWAVPDNHTIAVTLFRDQRTNELEDKDWIFILEDVSSSGRRRRVAQAAVNLCPLASAGPTQTCLSVQLRPSTAKVVSASLEVTISSVLLREGSATDEDMQSMASMMSVNNNSDIAPLEDFEEDDCSLSDNSASIKQMLDLTQQMELMTSSLAGTPASISSISSIPSIHDPFSSSPLDLSEDMSFNTKKSTPRGKDLKFTPTTKNLSKINLKPLDLKSNFNDYPYSNNLNEEDSGSATTTPIIDNKDKISNDRTPIVGNMDNVGKKVGMVRENSSEEKEVTPAQDLLEWCKEVTKEYPQCSVTNMTTSWTNGIAFCGIIHHFRPELIEMSTITPQDPDHNIRVALKASLALGVPGVFHASEMRRARGPDRLALLTYLHQLRALFTHSQLTLHKIGPTTEESSYTIGRFNTDKDTDISVELFSQEILTMRQKRMDAFANRTSLSSQDSFDSQNSQERPTSRSGGRLSASSPDKQPSGQDRSSPGPQVGRDVRGMLLASKSILGKVLSPTKEKLANFKSQFSREGSEPGSRVATAVNEVKRDPVKVSEAPQLQKPVLSPPVQLGVSVREAWPVKLMTRKQLTDPFASDEEDEELTVQVDEAKSTQTTSTETKEKKVVDTTDKGDNATSKDRDSLPQSPLDSLPKPTQMSEEARQAQLRERARKLIAEARAGITSPTSPGMRSGTVEVLTTAQALAEQQMNQGSMESSPIRSLHSESRNSDSENNILNRDESPENNGNETPSKRRFDSGVGKSSSPLHSFSNLMERISPDKEGFISRGFGNEMSNYILSEMEALEREQTAVDEQAASLEKELRAVMESGQSEAEENALMAKWFTLVNKKNALLRRQMQLNILEQESELERRHARVEGELRALHGVEEWRKSERERGREARLLGELLQVVDARDQLVHHMHEHEQAIEDDDEIERNLSNVELQRKNNCSIQ